MSAPPLPADEAVRRRLAYDYFNTDREAAEALGIEMVTFRFWRRRSGLAPHRHRASRYTSEERVAILALFRQLGRWPDRLVVERWL